MIATEAREHVDITTLPRELRKSYLPLQRRLVSAECWIHADENGHQRFRETEGKSFSKRVKF